MAFESLPVLDWRDPELKFIDLTGDGFPDLLISEDDAFCWYQSLSTQGFASGQRVPQALDEEKGPKLVFADGTESIFLADLSGDGLTDLVRIRNGEVCYWPNQGYGRFGAKITMDDAPFFDHPDLFDGRRIQLADIDGSGTADIVYFAGNVGPAVLQSIRKRLGCRAGAESLPGCGQRVASRRPRPARQRHGLPGLVVPAAGKRGQPDALHRPDGRARSRTCWSARRTTLAPRQSFTMPRQQSST